MRLISPALPRRWGLKGLCPASAHRSVRMACPPPPRSVFPCVLGSLVQEVRSGRLFSQHPTFGRPFLGQHRCCCRICAACLVMGPVRHPVRALVGEASVASPKGLCVLRPQVKVNIMRFSRGPATCGCLRVPNSSFVCGAPWSDIGVRTCFGFQFSKKHVSQVLVVPPSLCSLFRRPKYFAARSPRRELCDRFCHRGTSHRLSKTVVASSQPAPNISRQQRRAKRVRGAKPPRILRVIVICCSA